MIKEDSFDSVDLSNANNDLKFNDQSSSSTDLERDDFPKIMIGSDNQQ